MDLPRKRSRNPMLSANPVSRFFLTWIWKLFTKEYRAGLSKGNVWPVPPDDEAGHNVEQLEKNLHRLLEEQMLKQPDMIPLVDTHDPSDPVFTRQRFAGGWVDSGGNHKILLRALQSTFGFQYFSLWFYMMFTDSTLRVLQPIFLLDLLRSFLKDPGNTSDQYLYASGICLTTLALSLTSNPTMFHMGRLGLRCRVALTSLIQRKMLRLIQVGKGTDQGHLVTLLTNDAGQLERNIQYLPYIVIGPVQLVLFTRCLFPEFGFPSLAGIGVIILLIPFQCGSEVEFLGRRSRLHAIQMSLFLSLTRVVPFFTFVVFVLSGGHLTADKAFYAVAVYNTATHFLGYLVPAGIRGLGEIKGSLQRIQDFLLLPEKNVGVQCYTHDTRNPYGRPPSIRLQSVVARWTPLEDAVGFKLSIKDLNLEGNKLVVILGKVGSGKSSLLHVLLAELPIESGSCKIRGLMSYAPATPYIFRGTVRRNIVFNEEWDKQRYLEVITAAQLTPDFRQFPNGDKTMLTEGGSTLSGGQKHRVNLARALYRRAMIYLLHDPLSSVDSKVSQSIFNNCLGSQGLLSGQLRIVVTNQTHYLQQADHIVIIEQGSIKDQGTYEQMRPTLDELYRSGKPEADKVDDIIRKGSSTTEHSDMFCLDMEASKHEREGMRYEDEEYRSSNEWSTYWKYFKVAGANKALLILVVIFLISQALSMSVEFWLAVWANAEEKALRSSSTVVLPNIEGQNRNLSLPANTSWSNQTNDSSSGSSLFSTLIVLSKLPENSYIYVYLVFVGVLLVTNLIKAAGFFNFCMKICKNVHHRMLQSLLLATPNFFETNSSGKIMNRFLKDVGAIDEDIPFALFDWITIFLQIATVIVLICFSFLWFIVPIAGFLIALVLVRDYYLVTSRLLKQNDDTSRGPVYSQLSSSFHGLTTIRAFEAEKRNSAEFDRLQDINSASTFLFIAASRCFDIWVECIAICLLTVVTFTFIIAQHYLGMSFQSGELGLAIFSALSLTNWLQYGMRTSSDVENLMMSVERAKKYTKLPSEQWSKGKSIGNWPSAGKIEFRDVSLRYVENGPRVLEGVRFTVAAGEKFGIIGRTGAGKSSILRALYRMTELDEGKIYIDDVNTKQIELRQLRESISIFPQEPVLFENSLRFNLDPTGQFTDSEIRDVLQKMTLCYSADFEVAEGGRNLSVGERQLVSLARAVLRKTKIICLNEPTGNVDPRTDEEVQTVLREMLENCTVIAIAHRLHTIIDFDKVLVIENGAVVECDIPHILLQKREGAFSNLVHATGSEMEQHLRKKAEEKYNRILQKARARHNE